MNSVVAEFIFSHRERFHHLRTIKPHLDQNSRGKRPLDGKADHRVGAIRKRYAVDTEPLPNAFEVWNVVDVGRHNQVVVVIELEQNRVIFEAAIFVTKDDVGRAHGRQDADRPCHQVVEKPAGAGPLNSDLAKWCAVKDRTALPNSAVFSFRIAIMHGQHITIPVDVILILGRLCHKAIEVHRLAAIEEVEECAFPEHIDAVARNYPDDAGDRIGKPSAISSLTLGPDLRYQHGAQPDDEDR